METEYSDGEDDGEMSILDEHHTYDKENINDSNYEEDCPQDQHQEDIDKLNKGLEFKNKFIDRMDKNEMLFHRRNHDNEITNPLHFMHKIHQTEEDQEHVELIDTDFELNNLYKLNDEKANLIEALNAEVIILRQINIGNQLQKECE